MVRVFIGDLFLELREGVLDISERVLREHLRIRLENRAVIRGRSGPQLEPFRHSYVARRGERDGHLHAREGHPVSGRLRQRQIALRLRVHSEHRRTDGVVAGRVLARLVLEPGQDLLAVSLAAMSRVDRTQQQIQPRPVGLVPPGHPRGAELDAVRRHHAIRSLHLPTIAARPLRRPRFSPNSRLDISTPDTIDFDIVHRGNKFDAVRWRWLRATPGGGCSVPRLDGIPAIEPAGVSAASCSGQH